MGSELSIDSCVADLQSCTPIEHPKTSKDDVIIVKVKQPFGLTLCSECSECSEEYEGSGTVKVVAECESDSNAAIAGVLVGMVLMQVNGVDVQPIDLDTLSRFIHSLPKEKIITLTFLCRNSILVDSKTVVLGTESSSKPLPTQSVIVVPHKEESDASPTIKQPTNDLNVTNNKAAVGSESPLNIVDNNVSHSTEVQFVENSDALTPSQDINQTIELNEIQGERGDSDDERDARNGRRIIAQHEEVEGEVSTGCKQLSEVVLDADIHSNTGTTTSDSSVDDTVSVESFTEGRSSVDDSCLTDTSQENDSNCTLNSAVDSDQPRYEEVNYDKRQFSLPLSTTLESRTGTFSSDERGLLSKCMLLLQNGIQVMKHNLSVAPSPKWLHVDPLFEKLYWRNEVDSGFRKSKSQRKLFGKSDADREVCFRDILEVRDDFSSEVMKRSTSKKFIDVNDTSCHVLSLILKDRTLNFEVKEVRFLNMLLLV
jgi:hypothetical protein